MRSRSPILAFFLLASALEAAAAGYHVGPWGYTYARYDPALFGPEKPLALVLEESGIARGPEGKLEGARLLVIKEQRRCELWIGGTMVKAYRVQLSQNGKGAKSRRYDQRTPEGDYAICAHRPSKYHRGLWISYPGLKDAERGVKEKRIGEEMRARIAAALERGECPPQNTRLGGLVMLHGQQKSLTRSLRRARGKSRGAARTDLVEGDADPGAMREYHDWTAGCIAMFNPDIRELYELLPDGTPVTIVADGPVTRSAPRRPAP
jgi:murein L,D-transpeptidase YafK